MLFCSVESCNEVQKHTTSLHQGDWILQFDVGEVRVPIHMRVDSLGNAALINSNERVSLESIEWKTDSFHVKLPLFQTFLHGKLLADGSITGFLHDPTRSVDYKIPFTGRSNSKEIKKESLRKSKYDVTFSPDNPEDRYKAVGLFEFGTGGSAKGTFLTETGDYRYLEGRTSGDSLFLSCLDGAHLFYFTGLMKGDSIVGGMFYSGKHWMEPWAAVKNDYAELRDPDSLTTLNGAMEPFSFVVQNMRGDSIRFDSTHFKGKVSIVQIFGSWCPNCTDESIFLKSLYQQYSQQGLQIIPVGFERAMDFGSRTEPIQEQWNELKIPYPPYLGAGPGKASAEITFPMLSSVQSFPTSIIIDRSGRVVRIITGFYGPGTGDYYVRYTERLKLFVDQLLRES